METESSKIRCLGDETYLDQNLFQSDIEMGLDLMRAEDAFHEISRSRSEPFQEEIVHWVGASWGCLFPGFFKGVN